MIKVKVEKEIRSQSESPQSQEVRKKKLVIWKAGNIRSIGFNTNCEIFELKSNQRNPKII
jgi:hypothetical protein